jgi:hypothetical protein
MYYHPFKDRPVADQFAKGLLKAGIAEKLNDYLPAFKENQLNGEEIKRLFFGSTITGIGLDGQQWWIDRKKNGEFTYRGQGQFLLIRVRAGLRAICSAGSTKRALGELRFAGLFSDTPEARPRVKISISGAATLDFRLFRW